MINAIDTTVYAGRIKDESVRMKSSSGGAFTALSDVFLRHGGAVAAAAYDYEKHTTVFRLIETEEEREAAIGSKYMQSKPGDIFRAAYRWLTDHPEGRLLFVGMGCQADGFRRFAEMRNIRERVWIADIICFGSPSPRLWREYAGYVEKKRGGKITYVTFKDKRNGWKRPTAMVLIGGQEVFIQDYVRIFYGGCALRPSCHECPYAAAERKTDLTIGDFWHIEDTIPDFCDDTGNSLILIHTDRGEELFEQIKPELDYRLSDVNQCRQNSLTAPVPVSERRQEFWRDYQREGIEFTVKKYGKVPLRSRAANKLLSMIRRGAHR